MLTLRIGFALLMIACCARRPSPQNVRPEIPIQPRAAVRIVTTQLHGTILVDPYRWMEDVASSEFTAWATGQNAHTRAALDSLRVRGELLARITALAATRDEAKNVQRRMSRLFYLKRPATKNSFKLYMRNDGGPEQLLFDPDTTTSSSSASIDFYEPSPTGRHVAFGISTNGSEDSVLHVLDANTGALLNDTIDRARHGEPRWRPDGVSFFYRRNPPMSPGAEPSTRYQRSRDYLHVLGSDPDVDIAVFGYGVSPRAPLAATDSPYVYLWPGCAYVLGVAQHGTSSDLTIYVAPLVAVDGIGTPWRKLAGPEDKVLDFAVHGKDIFLLTHRDAPRAKVVRTSLEAPDLAHAETIIASSEMVVSELSAAKDALYVRALDDGLGRVIRVAFDGTAPTLLALPFDATIADFVASPTAPGFICQLQSWTRQKSYYAYDPSTVRFNIMSILPPTPPQAPLLESVEVRARSKDGTMVPLSLVYRRGIDRTRPHPTLLVSYGSYGMSLNPSFDARRLAWLERGGIYAVAHVRGGGEYGEEWHTAGMKQNKQNTIDDLIACAERLIALGYTSAAQLAGEGTSAGAIAISGAITQQPGLFAAALVRVGITDALRFETTALGPQNAQEFGSSGVPEELDALYRMSAYYHVVDRTHYPAVLLTSAAHDARVPVWQPAKMAARLQAATSSRKPILFRLDSDSGHGYGLGTTNAQLNEELADCYAFLLWQLSSPAQPH